LIFHDAAPHLWRATRAMSGTLNDLTGEGMFFAPTLRLRPDSGVTPVCMANGKAPREY